MDEAEGARPCPFCVGSAEVGGGWRVLSLPNRYPSLSLRPPQGEGLNKGSLYRSRPAYGACEVILETAAHEADLADLGAETIAEVLELFAERYRHYRSFPGIRYVFAFRNKGREIGVTLHHPHSQLYALPFIPTVIRRELASARAYWRRHGVCLFCRVVAEERALNQRVVGVNRHAIVFLPYYAKWPYELHVYPLRHVGSLPELSAAERRGFAELLKQVLVAYNNLFHFSMPYVLAVHQQPTDDGDYRHYHLHVECYPPYRARDRLKYPGGLERGTGTFIYDGVPEEKAAELKAAFASSVVSA